MSDPIPSSPRFIVSPAGSIDFTYFIVVDTVSNRIVAQSFAEDDATFVAVKLNQPSVEGLPDLLDALHRIAHLNADRSWASEAIAIARAALAGHEEGHPTTVGINLEHLDATELALVCRMTHVDKSVRNQAYELLDRLVGKYNAAQIRASAFTAICQVAALDAALFAEAQP